MIEQHQSSLKNGKEELLIAIKNRKAADFGHIFVLAEDPGESFQYQRYSNINQTVPEQRGVLNDVR